MREVYLPHEQHHTTPLDQRIWWDTWHWSMMGPRHGLVRSDLMLVGVAALSLHSVHSNPPPCRSLTGCGPIVQLALGSTDDLRMLRGLLEAATSGQCRSDQPAPTPMCSRRSLYCCLWTSPLVSTCRWSSWQSPRANSSAILLPSQSFRLSGPSASAAWRLRCAFVLMNVNFPRFPSMARLAIFHKSASIEDERGPYVFAVADEGGRGRCSIQEVDGGQQLASG